MGASGMFVVEFFTQIFRNMYTTDSKGNTNSLDQDRLILLDGQVQKQGAEATIGEKRGATILLSPETTSSGFTNTTTKKQDVAEDVAFDEEQDEPSRTRSDSSDSSWSMDDLSPSAWRCDAGEVTEEDRPVLQHLPRRVNFHPHVEVREYSITVSDHPCCEDSYPLSLDWAHAGPYLRYLDDSKTRGALYDPGRRLLCVEAKRRRLAAVRGCSENDIDAMVIGVPVPSSSPDDEWTSYFGRSIMLYLAKIRIPMVLALKRRDYLVDDDDDDDDDEYLLLYTGTTSAVGATTRPAPTVPDLESGFF
jgi:hypothetical protein